MLQHVNTELKRKPMAYLVSLLNIIEGMNEMVVLLSIRLKLYYLGLLLKSFTNIVCRFAIRMSQSVTAYELTFLLHSEINMQFKKRF
jgi:hypothetical protein